MSIDEHSRFLEGGDHLVRFLNLDLLETMAFHRPTVLQRKSPSLQQINALIGDFDLNPKRSRNEERSLAKPPLART